MDAGHISIRFLLPPDYTILPNHSALPAPSGWCQKKQTLLLLNALWRVTQRGFYVGRSYEALFNCWAIHSILDIILLFLFICYDELSSTFFFLLLNSRVQVNHRNMHYIDWPVPCNLIGRHSHFVWRWLFARGFYTSSFKGCFWSYVSSPPRHPLCCYYYKIVGVLGRRRHVSVLPS